MNIQNLEGTYVITAVDCVSSTTLSPLKKSKVGFKLNKDTPLGYYERLGTLSLSMIPYKNQGEADSSQELSLEVSDLDLKEQIEARAFGLSPEEGMFRNSSFSPQKLEDRLRGTLVDIILDDEGNIIPRFTYQEAQDPIEDRQLTFKYQL